MCPQPSYVSSRLPTNSRDTARAPARSVTGSYLLPTTSTGAEVRVSQGPVYRSSFTGHVAQVALLHHGYGPNSEPAAA